MPPDQGVFTQTSLQQLRSLLLVAVESRAKVSGSGDCIAGGGSPAQAANSPKTRNRSKISFVIYCNHLPHQLQKTTRLPAALPQKLKRYRRPIIFWRHPLFGIVAAHQAECLNSHDDYVCMRKLLKKIIQGFIMV
ncbi:MAG TPA: hypothetical protein DCP03_07700 [Polaromonas sp.]|nr:hypothetical protein [Polaromonas sp.]